MPREREGRRRGRQAENPPPPPSSPSISRRQFLLWGLGAITTLAGAGAIKHFADQSQIDTLLDDNRQKESQTEPFIQHFEQGFDSFINQTLGFIDKANLTDQEKEGLEIPFEIFKINRQNPERNTYKFRRKAIEQSRSLSTTQMTMENPNFFFYDFIALESGNAASLSPIDRTLQISNRYDPNNILDNLIAMHELIHVAQDNQLKDAISQDAYKAFYSPPVKKMIGLHEATAYMKEIFVLNLFTQDQFRQDVIKNKGHVDIQKYMAMLHAHPEQSGTIDLLGQMAYAMYTGRTSLTGIDSNFLAHINSIYRAKGYTPYMQTPNGFVVDQN